MGDGTPEYAGPWSLEHLEAVGLRPSAATLQLLRPVGLAALAGGATTIGGLIAVWRRPDEAMLALMLGLAFGVMVLLSVVELLVRNAMEGQPGTVVLFFALGGAAYYLLAPFIPEVEMGEKPELSDGEEDEEDPDRKKRSWRLGVLMMATMTIHNLPEGLAVAFAAHTKIGPVMALAIAIHNIPEGVIVAGPVYAATNSRGKALLMATASGITEPIGALIAMLLLRPYITQHHLQYLLAFVGGVMLVVSFVELLPEGRKCNSNKRLVQGAAGGAVAMALTLAAGV